MEEKEHQLGVWGMVSRPGSIMIPCCDLPSLDCCVFIAGAPVRFTESGSEPAEPRRWFAI